MTGKKLLLGVFGTAFALVALAPVVILLGYTAPAISRLEERNNDLVSRLNAHESFRVDGKKHREEVMQQLQKNTATSGGAPPQQLPYKWAAKYLLPRHFQENRGTCWDFAAVGILEQSYRANGVAKGFLRPNEYVKLNKQSYGLSMIEACKDKPDVCDVVGDFVFHNSTQGGEVWWLYNLADIMSDKILPSSVCPYLPEVSQEHVCPAMNFALKKNPIKFSLPTMKTAYNVRDTKQLMVAKDAPLAWSSEMHNTVYHFPCTDDYWKTQPECHEDRAVACPTDRYYNSDKCARILATMFNLDGEFFMMGETIGEGGHAMNVVGYNDEFVTRNGQKGGFIIRNSWYDQLYGSGPSGRGGRGSHSVAYWMQEISSWDEKMICPLPLNPDNWMSCVQMEVGPSLHAAEANNLKETYDISQTCLNPSFMKNILDVSLQPNEFQCTDSNFCSSDKRYRYFLIETVRNQQQDLARACMLQYDTVTGEQMPICTTFMIPARLAYIWKPVDSQLEKLKDNEDLCGYWFWPYEMLEKQMGLYQNFYTTWFDLRWEDRSYVARASNNFDYQWIKKSTHVQQEINFDTPSPFATKRY